MFVSEVAHGRVFCDEISGVRGDAATRFQSQNLTQYFLTSHLAVIELVYPVTRLKEI